MEVLANENGGVSSTATRADADLAALNEQGMADGTGRKRRVDASGLPFTPSTLTLPTNTVQPGQVSKTQIMQKN